MQHNFESGALLDERPEAAKARDWTQREVVAAGAQVQWAEKPQDRWRKFPIFDQDGSGSCVMQTECKEMGIMRSLKDGNYVHFSVADGYQRRANRPGSGMGADDARRIARDGITLEDLAPSQGMSDQLLDAAVVEPYKREVGAVFSVPNYLAMPGATVEGVASTIQATGKGVMVWFYFDYAEWTDRPNASNPGLVLSAASTIRHSVTAVDFTLQGNEKCLVIEDSWGLGAAMNGQRVISEAFFRARNWYSGYLVNFRYDGGAADKPRHSFESDLELGVTGQEVAALQDCLRYDGEFPANTQSTGYYGQITAKAVGDYQVKHGVVAGPSSPGYGRCGPATRAALNAQFS